MKVVSFEACATTEATKWVSQCFFLRALVFLSRYVGWVPGVCLLLWGVFEFSPWLAICVSYARGSPGLYVIALHVCVAHTSYVALVQIVDWIDVYSRVCRARRRA